MRVFIAAVIGAMLATVFVTGMGDTLARTYYKSGKACALAYGNNLHMNWRGHIYLKDRRNNHVKMRITEDYLWVDPACFR